ATSYTTRTRPVPPPTNEFSLNAATIVADWTNLTGIPINLDQDSTDDFNGDFAALTNVPAGLADGDDDTTYTAGTGLLLSPLNEFSLDAVTASVIEDGTITNDEISGTAAIDGSKIVPNFTQGITTT